MAQYYDNSNLWDDSPNKTDNYSTLGQVLSIGDAFQNANTISDENVQNTILGAKNDLSSYEEYLKNLQGSNSLEDALKFKNNLHFLDLNLTPDLGYDHNPWANIAKSTAQGASAGSAGGLWGTIGGAATGLHMSVGSELGGKRGANASIGSNLGALFLSPLTGGDPLTGGILGGIIGYNWDKSEDDERQKVYNELKAKEQEYQNYANNFANMNIDNAIKRNYRNMMTGMKAFGGYIGGNGGDWTNGLTFINSGNSHEANPYGGVPVGIAPDGNPNLVEQGEIIWNDYVFSDRIKVPKDIIDKYKLKGKDMTFAKAVEKLQKSAEQRPNDSIEKRGLDATLAQLAQEQEIIRQQQAEQDAYNQAEDMAAYAADGGPIHIAKNKRGTFTAAATKHGMGVQEFARKVLANKEDYSPAIVRKANFARNASSWKHALGGYLFGFGGNVENTTTELLSDEIDYTFTNGYKPSQLFIDTIKKSEAYRDKIYQNEYEVTDKETGEKKKKLDKKTIGYGTTDDDVIAAFEGKTMSEKQADYYLKRHVDNDIKYLKNGIGKDNWNKLPRHTKEMLLDYAYVRGVGNAIDAYLNYNGDIKKHYEDKNPEIAIPNRLQSILDTYTEDNYTGNTVNTSDITTSNSTTRRSLLDEPIESTPITEFAFGGPKGHYFLGIGDEENELTFVNPNGWLAVNYPTEGLPINNPEYDLDSDKAYLIRALSKPQEVGAINPKDRTTYVKPENKSVVPTRKSPTTKDSFNASYLRYAPVLGSAISSLAAALDSPNRTYANNLRKSAKTYSNMMQPVSARPLANYLRYDPLDRMFYANQLEANAAATRSAIAANANANRQAAVNNLLAANYGTNIGLGNLYRQVEEANRDQRAKVAEFNRGTDQYNATAALDAAKTNAAIRQAKASMLWDAAQRANAIDMNEDLLVQQARSQALTNLFNNLGGIGKEEYIFQMMRDNPDLAYYLTGLGNMNYKKPQ